MHQWQSQLQNSLWEVVSIRVRNKSIYMAVRPIRTCHVVVTSQYKLPDQKEQKSSTYCICLHTKNAHILATDLYFSVTSLYNDMLKGSLGVRKVCCYPLAAYWRLFDCCDSSRGAAVVFLVLWSSVVSCSICSMSHGRAECDNRPSVFPCLTSSEEDFRNNVPSHIFFFYILFCQAEKRSRIN